MGIYEFNGKKYEQASRHQKEWGQKLFSDLHLNGNESILDLGWGDGVLTEQLSMLVPEGSVIGIDASIGMINTASPRAIIYSWKSIGVNSNAFARNGTSITAVVRIRDTIIAP